MTLALLTIGGSALGIPADTEAVFQPLSMPGVTVRIPAQGIDMRTNKVGWETVRPWRLAEAPVFRPDNGRTPRAPTGAGRFRPDSRDESMPPNPDSSDRREESPARTWPDQRHGRFRPLPEKKRRYEEIYPPPAEMPPLPPVWVP